MAVTRAKSLQRSIIISSVVGIFGVGIIVAVVSIFPLYQHFKKGEEQNLTMALNTKTLAVEEYLIRAKDVALQISARTTARQKLEEYNAGRASLEELAAFTSDVLADAMSYSHEVWGINRLDERGNPVVQIGIELPKELWPQVDEKTPEAYFSGPVTIGMRPYLIVVAPILNRASKRVGTDIVLFRLFHLERIVEDYIGLGQTGETIIGVIGPDKVDLVFPLRGDKASAGQSISKKSRLGAAFVWASMKQPGISNLRENGDVIAYGPIRYVDWGIVVRMDKDELYAPVSHQILATLKTIIALLLLGTLGIVLLVHPLTGKMIIHTDELAREIEEKTASLQKELEGRKRMERWLIDSERRYRMLLEEVPDVIFILDRDGRFVYVNTQVEKFLDCPVFQILETPFTDYVIPEDKAKAETIPNMKLDSIWDQELGMIAPGGERKYARIRCKASPSVENGSTRFEGVMRDITTRRALEEDLKASREELLEKIKIIDDLYEHLVQQGKSKAIADHTAEVAHELRQPLAIIGGFARRIARQLDSRDQTADSGQRESCGIMISEIQRLERILSSLIDFTRHERIRLERVDPNEVIEKVLKVYQDRMIEKNLRLVTNLGKELGEVMLDPNRFEQVVRNLVSNAIEASSPDEVIYVETGASIPSGKAQETGGLESESYFEMKIRNCGKVIPPDELQKIFSPFYTTKNYGTGIGLTISKRIIEDHRGSISAKSDNEGTVFTVWLPLDHAT
jgi:PAS domain S-box-containing protein